MLQIRIGKNCFTYFSHTGVPKYQSLCCELQVIKKAFIILNVNNGFKTKQSIPNSSTQTVFTLNFREKETFTHKILIIFQLQYY